MTLAGKNASVSPFDHRIELGGNMTEACDMLLGYYNNTKIEIFYENAKFRRSGKDMIHPLVEDAHVLSQVLYCDRPNHYLQNNSIMMGLFGTGVSYVYLPLENRLEV